MELTREQIIRHKDQILNVLNEVTVKTHQARSKTGKVFTVKQHERNVSKMSDAQLNREINRSGPLAYEAEKERSRRERKVDREIDNINLNRMRKTGSLGANVLVPKHSIYDKQLAGLSKSGANRVRAQIKRGSSPNQIKLATKFQKKMDAKNVERKGKKKASLNAMKKQWQFSRKGRGSWGAMGRLGIGPFTRK